MKGYTVIFEPPARAGGNWSCYVPDIPGCVGISDTREACRASVAQSFAMYAEDYRERGAPLPEPSSQAETLEMAA